MSAWTYLSTGWLLSFALIWLHVLTQRVKTCHFKSGSTEDMRFMGQQLQRAVTLSWLLQLSGCASSAAYGCIEGQTALRFGWFLDVLCSVLLALVVFNFQSVALRRFQLIETGFGRPIGSKLIKLLQPASLWGIIAGALWQAIFEANHMDLKPSKGLGPQGTMPYDMLQATIASVAFLSSASVAGYALTVIRRRTNPTLMLKLGMNPASYAAAEASWAYVELKRLRLAMCLPFLSVGLGAICCIGRHSMLLVHSRYTWNLYATVVPLVQTFSVLLELACSIVLAGFFSPKRPSLQLQDGAPFKRVVSPRSMMTNPEWVTIVEDLASRSISAVQLLEFWDRLGPDGDLMPSYRPQVSTTNDVVRQAIIPLSSSMSDGECFARCLNPNSRNHPSVMVTHNWGNLFLHLVAAVVADALGEPTYELIAFEMVSGGVAGYLHRLRDAKLDTRYWICAFCVNQHSSICSSFGIPPETSSGAYHVWDSNRRDTVTGEIFPACECKQTKIYEGIHSEMNKFDDMMAVLRSWEPNFRHLVAVDRQFHIFSRAWCVAELVEAHNSCIPQTVQIHSDRDLDQGDNVFVRLAKLTVADCTASRPEDKEEILARISDIPAFDAHLQMAVFGQRGLLRMEMWGFGVLDVAARIARRCDSFYNSEPLG